MRSFRFFACHSSCHADNPSVQTERTPRPRRPFGVVLLTLLWLAYGGLAALAVFDVPGVPIARVPRALAAFGLVEAASGVVAIVSLLTAIGLWFQRPWGWVLAMLVAGIGLAFDIVGWFSGTPAYAYLLLGVVIAFYLNQGDVRRRFLITAGEPEAAITLADGERGER
jgi:hypothetical protein